ncbi:hypothetical protein ACF0H5_017897 [Mactra antiquata]
MIKSTEVQKDNISARITPEKIINSSTEIHTNDVNLGYGNGISVRITPRDNGDQNDFETYRRKRPRRFCLLGLSKNVNTDVLSSVISQKGPIVTNMTVFPTRNNPDKVVIRLNVRDSEYADRLLQNDFWPSYVTCKVWRSRSSMQRYTPPRMRTAADDNHYADTNYSNYNDSEYSYGSRYYMLSGNVD